MSLIAIIIYPWLILMALVVEQNQNTKRHKKIKRVREEIIRQ